MYQLTTAKVTFMVVHSSVLGIVLSAARLVKFPLDRIILLDQSSASNASSMINSVPELISVGRQKPRAFYERPLHQEEGKTKIALLCWSSGTTGKPKVVVFLTNVVWKILINRFLKGSGYSPSCSYCQYNSDGSPQSSRRTTRASGQSII